MDRFKAVIFLIFFIVGICSADEFSYNPSDIPETFAILDQLELDLRKNPSDHSRIIEAYQDQINFNHLVDDGLGTSNPNRILGIHPLMWGCLFSVIGLFIVSFTAEKSSAIGYALLGVVINAAFVVALLYLLRGPSSATSIDSSCDMGILFLGCLF
jgi:hypothetical protein